MKTPKFITTLSAILKPRPKKRLQATARAARRPVDDYDDEEPTTKLSSAFVVVLILHVVAVGGIYAFNSIKASRRNHEQVLAAANAAPAANLKSAANVENASAPPPVPAANIVSSKAADPASAPAPST